MSVILFVQFIWYSKYFLKFIVWCRYIVLSPHQLVDKLLIKIVAPVIYIPKCWKAKIFIIASIFSLMNSILLLHLLEIYINLILLFHISDFKYYVPKNVYTLSYITCIFLLLKRWISPLNVYGFLIIPRYMKTSYQIDLQYPPNLLWHLNYYGTIYNIH